ncbi:MAG: lysophospholipase [Deltaproteobacteria bacterium]|nr:lysophospholipase [Deltaproteobacteria bacterium]
MSSLSDEFKPSTEEFYFTGPKNLKLFGRRWALSNVSSKGTIIGVHGYSEHGGRYAHFANFLNQNGYDVFFIDLPGHGKSEGRRSDIKDFDEYVRSVELFINEVESRNSPKPFHLFAHSMGGLVSTRLLEASSYADRFLTVTLSSPLFGIPRFKSWQLPWLKLLFEFVPNFTLKNDTELGEEVLARDREILESRLQDPLIKSCVTIQWFRSFVRARSLAFQSVKKIRVPVGIFQAGDERVVSRIETERFYSLIPTLKFLKIYPNFLHEILNDIERKQVMNDMLKWIEQNR